MRKRAGYLHQVQAADHAIHFICTVSWNCNSTYYAPLPTGAVEIPINPTTGGNSNGYTTCSTGSCSAHMSPYNAYHELGHVIGLMHEFQRHDRNHYVILASMAHSKCGQAADTAVGCTDGNHFIATPDTWPTRAVTFSDIRELFG